MVGLRYTTIEQYHVCGKSGSLNKAMGLRNTIISFLWRHVLVSQMCIRELVIRGRDEESFIQLSIASGNVQEITRNVLILERDQLVDILT